MADKAHTKEGKLNHEDELVKVSFKMKRKEKDSFFKVCKELDLSGSHVMRQITKEFTSNKGFKKKD